MSVFNNLILILIQFHSFSKKNIKHINPNVTKWYNIVPEPENKLTYLTFRQEYFQELFNTIGRTMPSSTLLAENTYTVPFYFPLPSALPYSKVFREKIDHLISSGIIQKWHDEFFLVEQNSKKYEGEKEPEILSVNTLRYGFYAYLIALTTSVLVFIGELLVGTVKRFI